MIDSVVKVVERKSDPVLADQDPVKDRYDKKFFDPDPPTDRSDKNPASLKVERYFFSEL